MISTVQVVAVADDSITAVEHDGDVWVSVRRVCLSLGLDPDGQRRKLSEKPWARTAMIAVQDTTGREQNAFMLALKSLPMWLGGIDHNKVELEVSNRLVRFQMEAHDALAAHFGLSGAPKVHGDHLRASSGGTTGSGASSIAAKNTAVGSGSALQVLSMVEGLAAAMRETLGEVAEVRALVDHNHTALQAELAEARKQTAAALAVADRAVANSTFAREDRRRCDAAVTVITRAVKGFAASRGDSYQDLYSRLRRELGLRPSSQGGKTLGKSKLSASQVLVLSDAASRMGVAGVGAARIRAILDGVEIVPIEPAQAPRVITPRADDVVIGGES